MKTSRILVLASLAVAALWSAPAAAQQACTDDTNCSTSVVEPVCVGSDGGVDSGVCGCNLDQDCDFGRYCGFNLVASGQCYIGCFVPPGGNDHCAPGDMCSVQDGGVGACTPIPDAGDDGGADAGADASDDAGNDASADAAAEAGSDAGDDAATDASADAEAGTDASAEGGTDAGGDATISDAGVDDAGSPGDATIADATGSDGANDATSTTDATLGGDSGGTTGGDSGSSNGGSNGATSGDAGEEGTFGGGGCSCTVRGDEGPAGFAIGVSALLAAAVFVRRRKR